MQRSASLRLLQPAACQVCSASSISLLSSVLAQDPVSVLNQESCLPGGYLAKDRRTTAATNSGKFMCLLEFSDRGCVGTCNRTQLPAEIVQAAAGSPPPQSYPVSPPRLDCTQKSALLWMVKHAPGVVDIRANEYPINMRPRESSRLDAALLAKVSELSGAHGIYLAHANTSFNAVPAKDRLEITLLRLQQLPATRRMSMVLHGTVELTIVRGPRAVSRN
jgi:hypothetical protein